MGRSDIADALLFVSDDAKTRADALPHSADRFRHAAVVVENEARDTPLERAGGKKESPASQILRYLPRAVTASSGAVQWGLLTNGRLWRLYWAKAPRRDEGFIEFDLLAGKFRSRDLVLAYMAALEAGAPDAAVAG